jgi:GNAT superfamily N-acetyltransferase
VSGVTIRAGRQDDLPRLAVIEDSGAETFTRYGQPLADGSPPAEADHWAPALDHGLLWVAENQVRGLIGFLAAELADGDLHVEEVDVLMEHQQRGHGRRLMIEAIDWARREGLAGVTLTTFRTIPWNAPFYASLGFEELAGERVTPRLGAILAAEASRGFEDRCAMRLAL